MQSHTIVLTGRGVTLSDVVAARAAYDVVRAGVSMLDGDRPLGPGIETVERALSTGHFEIGGGDR